MWKLCHKHRTSTAFWGELPPRQKPSWMVKSSDSLVLGPTWSLCHSGVMFLMMWFWMQLELGLSCVQQVPCRLTVRAVDIEVKLQLLMTVNSVVKVEQWTTMMSQDIVVKLECWMTQKSLDIVRKLECWTTLTDVDNLTVTLELHTPPYQYHTSMYKNKLLFFKSPTAGATISNKLKKHAQKSNHRKITTLNMLTKTKVQINTQMTSTALQKGSWGSWRVFRISKLTFLTLLHIQNCRWPPKKTRSFLFNLMRNLRGWVMSAPTNYMPRSPSSVI